MEVKIIYSFYESYKLKFADLLLKLIHFTFNSDFLQYQADFNGILFFMSYFDVFIMNVSFLLYSVSIRKLSFCFEILGLRL